MTLTLTIKILGWVMALAPLVVAMGVSFHLILGAADDDGDIKALITLGFAVTLLGVAILLLSYFTDLLLVL